VSRIYNVPFSGTITVAGGDADLFELIPADDKPIRLRRLVLGQTSEVGDAQEENLRLSIIRLPATVTSGSGGSAVTPAPVNSIDATAGFAAECNNTTIATTSGSAVTLEELVWNIRMGMDNWWPEERFAPSAREPAALVVRLQTTVASNIAFAGFVSVEEI
jgi:hypothetical protein